MNRLTERLPNGVVRAPVTDENRGDSCMMRLAAYEDTGLTPEEVAALKEQTRWIPVSERLPNMCGFKCLVCAKNKFEQTHVFTAFTGYMEHWKLEFHSCEPQYDDLSAWEITHWMPLPEAPMQQDDYCSNGERRESEAGK